MFATKLFLAALLAGGAAGLPTASSGQAPQIEWARLPDTSQMEPYYPARAKAAAVGGWGVIVCRVDDSGKLYGCKPAAEAPDGYGFGSATVAASRFFHMKAPVSAPDRRVIVPVFWKLYGWRNPPPPPTPGRPSLLVTINDRDTKREGTFACPSKQNPTRSCQAHGFDFEEAPRIEWISDLVRKAGGGQSTMECTVGDRRELKDCVVSNDGPQLTEADFYSLSTMFKAPAQTDDHIPTIGKHVVLTFDWTWLGKVVAVYDAS